MMRSNEQSTNEKNHASDVFIQGRCNPGYLEAEAKNCG